MNYFQKKLRQIMKQRHLSQTDLANMSGLRQTTISSWLKQDIIPKLSSIEPLAKALGLTVGDLIGDFGNKIELTEDDKRLLSLSPKHKKMLLSIFDAIAASEDISI